MLTTSDPGSNLPTHKLWVLGRTPIKPHVLDKYLSCYPNTLIAKKLSLGFSQGFQLHYWGPRIHLESKNLISAYEHHNELKEKITKEVELGRIGGPFQTLPISNLRTSPIGVVPKGDNSGWRLITHLSFPKFNSVNSFIDPEETSVKYTSFDSVIQMIAKIGKGANIGKRDIKSAFRLLPIYPGDFDLLGFKFDDMYYIDKCLPMGCSISCKVFEDFATFLNWLAREKSNVDTIDHYLDDFIFAGYNATICSEVMNTFNSICYELGVPLAEDKSVGPTTCLTFLGLEIDTIEMLVRIPHPKCVELLNLLQDLLLIKKVTLKQLQSILGKLNFFTRAIRPGRAFVRRLYDATIGVVKPHHYIRVTQSMREDIFMWCRFLEGFNGKVYFLEEEWHSDQTLNLFTDSSGSVELGCGAYFNGEWCFFGWPKHWKYIDGSHDMTFLELIPVVLSVIIWGDKLANKKITFHIDNQALVAVMNKQTSRSELVMVLVRALVLKSMLHNILFRAEYISTKSNIIADAISRKQWARFRQAAPNARTNPQPIPQSFYNIISSLNLIDS